MHRIKKYLLESNWDDNLNSPALDRFCLWVCIVALIYVGIMLIRFFLP